MHVNAVGEEHADEEKANDVVMGRVEDDAEIPLNADEPKEMALPLELDSGLMTKEEQAVKRLKYLTEVKNEQPLGQNDYPNLVKKSLESMDHREPRQRSGEPETKTEPEEEKEKYSPLKKPPV